MVLCSYGIVRDAEHRTYFFLRYFFQQVEAYYRPVAIGQPLYGFSYFIHFVLKRFLVYTVQVAAVGHLRCFDIHQLQFFFAQQGDGFVYHNPFQPGAKRAFVFEIIEVAESVGKRLLQDVFRIAHTVYDTQAGIEHGLCVFVVQLAVAQAVSLFTSFYEFVVWYGGGQFQRLCNVVFVLRSPQRVNCCIKTGFLFSLHSLGFHY